MSHSLDRLVDGAYRGRAAAEILDAPPDALLSISAADADRLQEAFGIRTVRDLARSPHYHGALAVLAAAGTPGFDPGPPPDWEAFFAAAPMATFLGRADLFRLEFGPVYFRGRLDGTARIIVVGQDPASDEILAHRIFVGLSGQRVQGFLRKLGLTRSYVMLNTFLFSIQGQFEGDVRGLSQQGPILTYRNQYLDRLLAANPVQAVVAVGGAARDAVDRWPGSHGLIVEPITHPASPNQASTLQRWNQALSALRGIVEPDEDGAPDPAPYGTAWTASDHEPIPRTDLPFGVPGWHGDGDRSQRDGANKIVWMAP
jgi:uracil-DNA glycosylase